MRYSTQIITLFILSSCATELIGLHRDAMELYHAGKYAEALPLLENLCKRNYAETCETLEDIKNKSNKTDDEGKELYSWINKRLLKNSALIDIGMSKNDILKLFSDPTSVSSSNGLVIWHYDFFRYFRVDSPTVPFVIKIKQGKVFSFGIDKEEEERRAALRQGKVSIQKEMGSSNSDSEKDD